MAKLANSAGFTGCHTNHSLQATAATRLYDQNIDEHRISKLTGHHSMAVRNYQCVSSVKEKEQSEVLYGKKPKKMPQESPTQDDSNFDISTLTQMQQDYKNVVKLPVVDVKPPVITFGESPIVVQPIINLNAKDLPKNNQGQVIMPEIKVELMININ